MHECINLLNQFKPDLIIAYSDAIYEISKYAKQNNINVLPQKFIHIGAGNLFDYMKEEISSCF